MSSGYTQADFRKALMEAAGKDGTRLVLAADDERWERVDRVMNAARGQLAAVKLHPEHAPLWGFSHPIAVDKIREASGGALVILDAKLADIDKSNAMKARYYFAQGYDAIICHGFEGKPGVQAVVDVANELGKGVFLVAAMSSEGHLFGETVVPRLVRIATELGVAGVIAPGNQYALTRMVKRIAKDLLVLSPGIGAQGGDAGKAAAAGTDFAIVGRAIMDAENVAAACTEINQLMNRALDARQASGGALAAVMDDRLLNALVQSEVLRFGDFTLKSGRKSTYFFNSGNLDSGEALTAAGFALADAIMEYNLVEEFDVILGPAYKGIPLGAAAAEALYQKYGVGKRFVFDRKEVKLHGDVKDKVLVGTLKEGDRVLLVDDVITTGDTKLDAMEKISASANGAAVKAVLVLLNRQEKDMEGNDPVAEMEKRGVRVVSVLRARELMDYLHDREVCGKTPVPDAVYTAFERHVAEYGV